MDIEIGQVLTQILAFLITFWILKKYAWQPILHVLEERKAKIETEFQSIEDQKLAADNLLASYEKKLIELEQESHSKIVAAVQEGQKLARHIADEAKSQAKETLQNAQNQIQKELSSAKISLKNDVATMAVSLTEKLLQDKLDAKTQKKLTDEAIAEVEKI